MLMICIVSRNTFPSLRETLIKVTKFITLKQKKKHSRFSIYKDASPSQIFYKTASNQSINSFIVSTICRTFLSQQYPPSFNW